MSQRKHVFDILQDTGLTGARPDKFPMEQYLKLTQDDKDVEQDALMSPNPSGKLEDLVVGCVCVV